MKMKKPNEGGGFQIAPEYHGPAVCVDVTPPEMRDTPYGQKKKFKLVFELPLQREGTDDNYCVWSAPFTPSLSERAAVRKFLKQWLGRDLTAQEIDDFAENENAFEDFCIGRQAYIIIQHVTPDPTQPEKIFANIVAATPHKGDPVQASGGYVRKKDRMDDGASYRKAESADDENDADDENAWLKTKVHVGKHAGLEIGDLDEDKIRALQDKWLPIYRKMEKPKAADRRLADAIEKAAEAMSVESTF